MARFHKDALYSGTFRLADGRKFVCEPHEIEHYARRLKDMVAAGLGVPLSWEHQGVQPMTAAERRAARAKHVLGWADDATPRGGILDAAFEVPVEADAELMPAVRFISPEITTDFVDGTGRLWPGKSITHFAVTARPVQPGQKAFQRAEAATLSLHRVRLSLGDFDMADEKDDKGKKGKPGDGDGDEGGGGDIARIADALRESGMTIPEEVKDADGLIIAIKAGMAGGGTPPEAPKEDVTEGAPPVVMSMAGRLLEMERKGLEGRIAALKGRVGKPVVDAMLARLKTERLSLDNGGRLNGSRLAVELEAYERLRDGFGAGASRLSLAEDLREADDTRETRDRAPETKDETDAALKAWDEAMGRKGA